ncbi:MAG: hypothetical protein OHK0046_21400 [Anaerolineae bacterium]
MLNYRDASTLANQRQEQLRREAEKNHQAQQAQQQFEALPQEPLYAPLMVRAGQALVNLGEQLQERYRTDVPSPAHS